MAFCFVPIHAMLQVSTAIPNIMHLKIYEMKRVLIYEQQFMSENPFKLVYRVLFDLSTRLDRLRNNSILYYAHHTILAYLVK